MLINNSYVKKKIRNQTHQISLIWRRKFQFSCSMGFNRKDNYDYVEWWMDKILLIFLNTKKWDEVMGYLYHNFLADFIVDFLGLPSPASFLGEVEQIILRTSLNSLREIFDISQL